MTHFKFSSASSLITGLVGLFASMAAQASQRSGLNLPRGVTEFSQEIYGLHMLIFWITVVIGVLVFGAMFYSMWAHRKSRGVKPAKFSHSTKVEVLWTIIPFLILVGMAIPATSSLIKMEQVENSEMTVKVTGHQWMWRYDYVDEGHTIYSRLDREHDRIRQKGSNADPSSVENYLLEVDNRLVLPANTKIRFLLTSDDVIHSWWVPDFGWKRDAIPGFINQAWTEVKEPGIYRGQCAELCGKDHGFMPIVVEVLPRDEYRQWIAAETGNAEAGARIAAQ